MSASNIIHGLEVLAATDFKLVLQIIKKHNINDMFALSEDVCTALSPFIPEFQDAKFALIALNYLSNIEFKSATVEQLEIIHPLLQGN